MGIERWKITGLAWTLAVVAGGCAEGDFDQDGMGLDSSADESGEVEELSQKSKAVVPARAEHGTQAPRSLSMRPICMRCSDALPKLSSIAFDHR